LPDEFAKIRAHLNVSAARRAQHQRLTIRGVRKPGLRIPGYLSKFPELHS
jgi:hypothetical protein